MNFWAGAEVCALLCVFKLYIFVEMWTYIISKVSNYVQKRLGPEVRKEVVNVIKNDVNSALIHLG